MHMYMYVENTWRARIYPFSSSSIRAFSRGFRMLTHAIAHWYGLFSWSEPGHECVHLVMRRGTRGVGRYKEPALSSLLSLSLSLSLSLCLSRWRSYVKKCGMPSMTNRFGSRLIGWDAPVVASRQELHGFDDAKWPPPFLSLFPSLYPVSDLPCCNKNECMLHLGLPR